MRPRISWWINGDDGELYKWEWFAIWKKRGRMKWWLPCFCYELWLCYHLYLYPVRVLDASSFLMWVWTPLCFDIFHAVFVLFDHASCCFDVKLHCLGYVLLMLAFWYRLVVVDASAAFGALERVFVAVVAFDSLRFAFVAALVYCAGVVCFAGCNVLCCRCFLVQLLFGLFVSFGLCTKPWMDNWVMNGSNEPG